MKRASLLLALFLLAFSASADETPVLLAKAWPAVSSHAGLRDIGAGVGIVFSPDLSVPGNCDFYTALGFACFDSADWLDILSRIHAQNISNPNRRIRTLILETHGTNGNGLKVQTGKKDSDPRSYISVGALQEWLEPVGVKHIVISACNSGRLLRPEIYLRLDRNNGDKLFLPATRGIIDASDTFDPKRNPITVITPGASQIETTLVGSLRELAPSTRDVLERAAKANGVTMPNEFAVSEMFIKMLLRDPGLELRTGAWVEELSKEQTSARTSERIFEAFVAHLNYVAARDTRTQTASAAGAR
ncbi:MAG TPA: hypothetical protein VND45_15890 [Thermoanaerobaculia bacterium]|jgi:hypothetical protein|nr:hypothetical protein [Thermoanaerobaculia bacterium]